MIDLRTIVLAIAASAWPSSAVALPDGTPDLQIHAPSGTRYELGGSRLTIHPAQGTEHALELGCKATSIFATDRTLYVACTGEEYATFSLADPANPLLEGRHRLDGELRGFFLHEGRVWVEILRAEAR